MSQGKHLVVSKAELIPDCWDDIVESNTFLTREYLKRIEEVNPCCQEYHMFFYPDIDSVIVTYKLNLDIFTYSRLSLKIPVTIIGIPCSVSKCGYRIGEKTRDDAYDFLNSIKGAKLILNTDNDNVIRNFAKGATLSACKLDLRWKTFDEYVASMRSHYRYRIKKAVGKWCNVEVDELERTSLFDEDLYKLYLQVYQKSNYKLEKLSIDFFREFPAKIIKFTLDKVPVAFIQLLGNGDELIFLFGGFDYALNLKYDIYINVLLEIVKRGIKGGFKVIDMGQTAEDTKMKLGCVQHHKGLYAGHSNALINYIVR